MEDTLFISDLQIPYHNINAIDFLNDLNKMLKPKKIICLGDEIDAASWSSFDKDPDMPNTGDELKATLKVMKQLYKIFPKVEVVNSNHTNRIIKKQVRAGTPRALIKSIKEVLEAPVGWNWVDFIDRDGVYTFHGEGFGGANAQLDMVKAFHSNVVHAHLHCKAGVRYYNLGRKTFWVISGGCLIDPVALAFAYSKHHKEKPVLGTPVIVDNMPYFFPLQ